jgi:hypothetical protein
LQKIRGAREFGKSHRNRYFYIPFGGERREKADGVLRFEIGAKAEALCEKQKNALFAFFQHFIIFGFSIFQGKICSDILSRKHPRTKARTKGYRMVP